MGRAPGPRWRRKGRAGGRRRGRPLSAERGSAPPSATAAAAAPRPPPRPQPEASPGGGLGAPGPASGAGLARGRGCHGRLSAPRRSTGPAGAAWCPASRRCVRRCPGASGPGPPGRCRPGALRAQHVGCRNKSRGSKPEGLREPHPRPHFTDAATEALAGPEPADKGGLDNLAASPPGPGSGGVRRYAEGGEPSFPPPRGRAAGTGALLRDRRLQTPGSSLRSAPRPPAEPRAALAHSRPPCARPPAAQAPRLSGRPPDPGATSKKAAPSNSERAERKGAGPGAGRSGIPERAPRPPPGTGRGRRALGADSAGGPHPLPRLRLCAGGGAPRSPRPLLRLLDLARVLKAGPGGTRASGRRVSLPPAVVRERLPFDLPRCLRGAGGRRGLDGFGFSETLWPPLQTPNTSYHLPPGYEKGPQPSVPSTAPGCAAAAPRGRVFRPPEGGTGVSFGPEGAQTSQPPPQHARRSAPRAGVAPPAHPHTCTHFRSCR